MYLESAARTGKAADMMSASKLLPLAAAALAAACWAGGAAAQSPYPSRAVTLIVPFPAGGGVDAVARIVAEKMATGLGQQVIIDNRGGVAGVIGMRVAAKAAPDGYTIVMSHTGITSINPTLYANPGYDAKKEFTPIGLIATTPIVLMTNQTFPVRTVADLIAMAKREPGKLNVGTPPPGTGSYLSAELFKAAAGIDFTIVTYKGTGPAHQRSPGWPRPHRLQRAGARHGQSPGGNTAGDRNRRPDAPRPAAGRPDHRRIRAARLRGRAALRPDGAGRHAGGRRRPPQQGVARDGEQPGVKARILADGGDPLPSTPEEYAADIAKEEPKWSALIRKLGLKVD